MNKTGAWLVRYALEQLGINHTFGIPGVQNAEIYDQLSQSDSITPHLVNHEMSAAFMADAVSRTHAGSIGTMVIVSGSSVTHSASGIGEALLAGVPMLIIAGSGLKDHAPQIDQEQIVKALTKAYFKIDAHKQIVETLFHAYSIATGDSPGPVFVEIPLHIQLLSADVDDPLPSPPAAPKNPELIVSDADITAAATQLLQAKNPGILVGWGAVDAHAELIAVAEHIAAPVCTTLSGISSFPASHPLHAGMLFGPAAVPSAENAFNDCDCLIAIGTDFSNIDTASGSAEPPEMLIHIDRNEQTFNQRYDAKITLCGSPKEVLTALLYKLQEQMHSPRNAGEIVAAIKRDKLALKNDWYNHNSKGRVNPAVFFDHLRDCLKDDAIIVTDDGNHTFLAAELMPINHPRGFISPSKFNAMGYCIPAVNAAKLVNPEKQVVGIVGDGAMLMTGMEALTGVRNNLGTIYCIFNDGQLSRITQSQQINDRQRKYTKVGNVNWGAFADAIDCGYIPINNNNDVATGLRHALETAAQGQPVFVDIAIDYSRRSNYALGVVKANLAKFSGRDKLRIVSRAIVRKFIG